MTPEKARDRATQAERLERDDAFQLVMREIRETQQDVFLNGDASPEAVMEAHTMIRALQLIDGQIRRMKTDAAILNRKENQDRG